MRRVTSMLMMLAAALLIPGAGLVSVSLADEPADSQNATAGSPQAQADQDHRPRFGRDDQRRRGRSDWSDRDGQPGRDRSAAGQRPFDGPPPPPHDDRAGDRPNHARPDPQQILVVLNDVMPHLAKRLEAVREQDERRFGMMVRRMGPRLRELIHDRQANPRLYQLKVSESRLGFETLQLVRQLRQAQADQQSPEKLQSIRDELHQVVADHFDVRQKLLEAKVAEMEKRLEQTREELADRAQRRDQLIDQRLEAVVSHRPGEHWKRDRDDQSGDGD